jgi:hypothetical protein
MPDAAVPPWRRERTPAIPDDYLLKIFAGSLRTPAPRAALFIGPPERHRDPAAAVVQVPAGLVWPHEELLRQIERVMREDRRAISFEYPHFAEALRAFESLMRARE